MMLQCYSSTVGAGFARPNASANHPSEYYRAGKPCPYGGWKRYWLYSLTAMGFNPPLQRMLNVNNNNLKTYI